MGKTTTITTSSRHPAYTRGDVITIRGRRAIVRDATTTSVTVAWRSAWYWRAWYWLREWWLFVLLAPIILAASFWMWRAFILYMVRS